MEDKMKQIRYVLIMLWMLLCMVTSAPAQVSIGIGLPGVSIGINLPLYPELDRVPGYPVYYAPRLDANYFFYDSMYWVYQGDNWYASSWYNGPWWLVEPEVVPLYILRVPVRYYRQPPTYFHGWRSNAPPRWGQHWGHEWEQRRSGWDKWNRRSAPAPAPLPVYQRKYTGDRYPQQVEHQRQLRDQNYRYQPRDKTVRQHIQPRVEQRAPAPAQKAKAPPQKATAPAHKATAPAQKAPAPAQRGKQNVPEARRPGEQEHQRSTPIQQGIPAESRSQPPHQATPQQRAPAVKEQRQQPGAVQHEQQAPKPQGQEQKRQERGKGQDPKQGHGQGQDKDEERGKGHNN